MLPTNSDANDPVLNDIKIEYHPQRGKPTHFYCFDDHTTSSESTANIPIDPEPWKPCQSCLDLEIAELSLDTK